MCRGVLKKGDGEMVDRAPHEVLHTPPEMRDALV
jgi:hypothetical protein